MAVFDPDWRAVKLSVKGGVDFESKCNQQKLKGSG